MRPPSELAILQGRLEALGWVARAATAEDGSHYMTLILRLPEETWGVAGYGATPMGAQAMAVERARYIQRTWR